MKVFKKVTSFIAAVVLVSSSSSQALHTIDWMKTENFNDLKQSIKLKGKQYPSINSDCACYFENIIAQFENDCEENDVLSLWDGIRLYFNLVSSYKNDSKYFWKENLPKILNRWYDEKPFALYSLITFLQDPWYELNHCDLNSSIITIAKKRLLKNLDYSVCNTWNAQGGTLTVEDNPNSLMKIFPPNISGMDNFSRQAAVLKKLDSKEYDYLSSEIHVPIIEIKTEPGLMSIKEYMELKGIQRDSKKAVNLALSLLDVLNTLHEHEVIFNCQEDVENSVLIDKEGHPKIVNFSNSFVIPKNIYYKNYLVSDLNKIVNDIILKYLISEESELWQQFLTRFKFNQAFVGRLPSRLPALDAYTDLSITGKNTFICSVIPLESSEHIEIEIENVC